MNVCSQGCSEAAPLAAEAMTKAAEASLAVSKRLDVSTDEEDTELIAESMRSAMPGALAADAGACAADGVAASTET